jgi:hypothetical protein
MKSQRYKWFVWNLSLLGVLLAGLIFSVQIAIYTAMSLIWIMLILYTFLYYTPKRNTYVRPVSFAINLVFDLSILIIIFSQGWRLTGIAYLLSCILLEAVYRDDENKAR